MEIEIKVLWCKGLTAFNFFQKLSIYTNVSIKHEDERIELTQQQKQEQKTPVDEDGDGNPEWNHTIKFDLRLLETIGVNLENLSIVFEFRHQGQLFGDKTVGQVCVPLRSLIDSVGFNVVRFVSYEVRSPEGKHNGILDFSYKLFGQQLQDHHSENQNYISGYHHHDNHIDHNHSHNTSHGQIINHYHQHYHLEQHSSFDSEKIEYPKLELEDWSANNTFSTMNTNVSHYPPPPPVVYPSSQQYQWSSPSHFPPPPPPPVVYPGPQYGDPHWGYYRPPPPGNNQPNSGYHHW